MLLATSAAAQVTMIDGDATSDTDDGTSWVQTVEQEPATGLTHRALPSSTMSSSMALYFTPSELEKKLWRRHQDRFLREKNDD